MFDNIKLCLPYRFSDNAERERFCSRFGLLVKDEKKQIYNNKGYETLSQNKGVYIHLKNSRLTLEFSLHKFFNYCLYSKPLNYNDFNFKEAKQAAEWLDEMFKPYFDIMHSKVMKYEVGINVITSENPDLYLQELKQMNISVKILPIKEDIHYKEYKQFSTQRDSGKRIIYIFYNKTFEARSKTKNMQAKMNVPENVLRVEKDNKRPTEKIPFARLFDKDFISFTVNEFKTRFCENLEYRGNPQKPENMNKADFELLQLVYEKGRDGANSKIENDYKNGIIKRANYFNRLRAVKEMCEIMPKITVTNSQRANELNTLISSKIREVQNFGLF